MELGLFDEVAEVARGLVPDGLGPLRTSARRYGLKAWFGPPEPPREHYEAQVIGAKDVPEATVLALEVGFHTEHPKAATNEEVLARLLQAEARWRKRLGKEAVAGPFLGRATNWRRVSETWPDPDLGGEDLGIELAVRLNQYVTALEPVRRQGGDAR